MATNKPLWKKGPGKLDLMQPLLGWVAESDSPMGTLTAICFEVEMPSGLARMICRPGNDGSLHRAVESKKKGWNPFTEHHYHPVKPK